MQQSVFNGHNEGQAQPHSREARVKNPKLLFLTLAFPPVNAPACVRTWNIARHLAALDWEVTIVTANPSLFACTDDDDHPRDSYLREAGIRSITTNHRWRCLAPDILKCWNENLGWVVGGVLRRAARELEIQPDFGWIQTAEKSCSGLNPADIDVILATGPPFGVFTLAKRLSRRLNRPYVLDYRDPWTGNPHHTHAPKSITVSKESDLLENSSAVTIVSPSWKRSLDARFGTAEKSHVVTNGYDRDDLEKVQPYNFGHFAIVYAGLFYPPKRVISPVMAALKRLKKEERWGNGQWYFHYYGTQENHVLREADRFGVKEHTVLHGRVSRAEALSAVRGAGVAVVITSVENDDTIEDRGIIPGKVFEALGLGTPILLIAPSGSDVTALTETTGLVSAFTGKDIEGMASFLKALMAKQIPQAISPQAYAWPNVIKEFNRVLRQGING
jgi:glycosyltransferase involved in cell wall biosynthesis